MGIILEVLKCVSSKQPYFRYRSSYDTIPSRSITEIDGGAELDERICLCSLMNNCLWSCYQASCIFERISTNHELSYWSMDCIQRHAVRKMETSLIFCSAASP